MARQIKTFKRKYRSVEVLSPKKECKQEIESKEETPISLYEATHNFIQKSWELGNPLDHKDMLKNLLLVIADNRLLPSSSVYEKKYADLWGNECQLAFFKMFSPKVAQVRRSFEISKLKIL